MKVLSLFTSFTKNLEYVSLPSGKVVGAVFGPTGAQFAPVTRFPLPRMGSFTFSILISPDTLGHICFCFLAKKERERNNLASSKD